jgi:xanthine dehydrogenase YagR molybdenum-binding subunit
MAQASQLARTGTATPRIDGHAKVTGTARYGSDEPVAAPAYAFLVTSSIARGRVQGFNLEAARAVSGLLDILTHENVGHLAKPPPPPGGKGGATTTSMESDQVWHDGQIVAVVVAETFEAAREAAYKVEVRYDAEQPSATFGAAGATTEAVADVAEQYHDPAVGNAESAFATGEVKLDQRYGTPTQHHNPIELFASTCEWVDDRLTIYESSQFVRGLATAVAKQIGIEPDRVRVISRHVGGAFGSRGGVTHRTAWIAIAARRINRPVKLVATRDQAFTIVTYRAETRHRVRLAATAEGRLQALIHEGWEATSRPCNYYVAGTETTTRVYACPNVAARVHVVHLDRNTPGFMRAPPDTPYMFALESAMDELAIELGLDPIELRLRNDTDKEPIGGLVYTSRSLRQCFEQGRQAFQWSERNPTPRSMREGDWLIGYGCATAAYPSNIGAATARVTLASQAKARVQIGAHDIGTGTYTLIALLVAERLGLAIDRVTVELGDSDLPPAGLAAGSSHAASVANVVAKACDDIRNRIATAATQASTGPFARHSPQDLSLSAETLRDSQGNSEPLSTAIKRVASVIETYAENVPQGAPPNGAEMLYQGQLAMARGSERKDAIAYGFGAQFVEVRIHSRTAEVRVQRALGAFAAGTIINPLTAKSQLMGGMIWGISSALHEATEIDKRLARYYNDDLAEYLVPVNADIRQVEVLMIPEHDTKVNPLGIKGIGELGTVGMNAAIANAVYHATGKRLRELPIRIEHLLA